MIQSNMEDKLIEIEGILAQGQADLAVSLLSRMAQDAEEYIAANCNATETDQWFSFPTVFDRLAYRRVEKDPRELHDVGEPLDRMYANYGLALIQTGELEQAKEALKQAVRWNPMNCGYRLDLAEIYRAQGDDQEYLALSYSVFSRASDVRHLCRAYANFARHYADEKKFDIEAALLRCAQRLDAHDEALEELIERAKGTQADPDALSDNEMNAILENEGIPEGANAEIAICLLMCATDAARAQDRNLATNLTLRARDLVGARAAEALIELIRESDQELQEEQDKRCE